MVTAETIEPRLPSIKQMAQRCYPFHARALKAIRDGVKIDSPQWQTGDYRGLRTVLGTLSRWRCIDGSGITQRGRDLIAELDTHSKTVTP